MEGSSPGRVPTWRAGEVSSHPSSPGRAERERGVCPNVLGAAARGDPLQVSAKLERGAASPSRSPYASSKL